MAKQPREFRTLIKKRARSEEAMFVSYLGDGKFAFSEVPKLMLADLTMDTFIAYLITMDSMPKDIANKLREEYEIVPIHVIV